MKPLKRIFEKDKLRNRKSSPSPSRNNTQHNDNAESDPSSLLSTISPDSTLGSGNLRMAVALPEGEDLNEWIACNISDFYKQTLMLYGSVLPLCTAQSCPVMSATSKYVYHWQENNSTVQLSAPQYVDRLMTWINTLLEDERIFPSKIGVSFPPNFRDTAHRIMRRLFRIYAHIYCRHLQDVRSMDMEPHLNSSFKHFIFFAQEFQILSTTELEPLQPCIDVLTRK